MQLKFSVGPYSGIAYKEISIKYMTSLLSTKNMKCQHNPYLESIKTSIIGRKLGKYQKAYQANFGA